MIYKTNYLKQIKPIIKDLTKECFSQRPAVYDGRNQYALNTKHKDLLYKLFISFCKKKLNKFTLTKDDLIVWCYFSNKDYHFENKCWHNHINSSTIVGVLYLDIPEDNKGIDFFDNGTINYKVKKGDFLIFPNFLSHFPYPSKDKTRISINLELNCKEPSFKIFDL